MVFFWITIIDSFDEIRILIMIHGLDSKLISKTRKEKKKKRKKTTTTTLLIIVVCC